MSLRKSPPCKKDGKNCDKRHVGCHSNCKEYAEWEKARHEELDKKRKFDTLNHQLKDAECQRAIKFKEGRWRWWK